MTVAEPDTEGDVHRRALRASWERNARAWTRAVRERAIPSRLAATDAAIISACRRVMDGRAGLRVLDVGCGEGWLVRDLEKEGAIATGIDASAPLIDAARAAHDSGDYACVTYEQLVNDASVMVGPFDLIVCNFALLDDRVECLLAALAKRLPASGVILVQTVHPWAAVGDAPYDDGWLTETWSAFGETFGTPMPWYFRRIGSWVSVARNAHLVVDRLDEPIHPETGRPLSLLLELA